MKCKDCYARNDKDICLIGKKSRMLVCGHYGCDLQARVVERKMGIEKPFTNADRIRAMKDEEMARWIAKHAGQTCPRDDRDCVPTCEQCWLEWLQEDLDKHD